MGFEELVAMVDRLWLCLQDDRALNEYLWFCRHNGIETSFNSLMGCHLDMKLSSPYQLGRESD
jgi:hypothetical protein